MHKELGYPPEIMDFDWSEESEDMHVCLNYGVWDIEKGLLIKLGDDKEVLQALRGRKKLTKAEI